MPSILERTRQGLSNHPALDLANSAVFVARNFPPAVPRGFVADLKRPAVRDAPPRVHRTTFDPTLPSSIANPYPQLDRLREHGVAVNERLGVWMLSRYDDVSAAIRSHDVMSSASGIFLRTLEAPAALTTDAEEHTRLRSLTAPAFGPKAIKGLEADVRALAGPLVHAMAHDRTLDLVRDLAIPLPVRMIAHILGVPDHRWREFRAWSDHVSQVFSPRTVREQLGLVADVIASMAQLEQMTRREFALRAINPAEDVFTRLQRAQADGELTRYEAFVYVLLLIVAGNETTTNLLGILMQQLADDPGLYARLREDRSLLPAVIEEGLRWGSPVQWVTRVTRAPYDVNGVTIPQDSRVVLFYASANHDPDQFPNPDVFDPERAPGRALSFGSGPHFCLGAHLARLETKVALELLLDHAATIEPAGQVVWTTTPSLQGPVSVPVRLGA